MLAARMMMAAAGRRRDPYTMLQLSFDGTDGATTTTDDTGRHGTITFNGNAQIDTAQSKFGGSALLLDGTGDYVTTPDSPDWDFSGGENWTIECWIRFAATGGNQAVWEITQDSTNANYGSIDFGGSNWGISHGIISGGTAIVSNYDTGGGEGANYVAGNWYHVVWEKSGTTYRVYRDGTVVATKVDSDVSPNLTGVLQIGASTYIGAGSPSAYFNGWIDELRVSKGIARYNGAFTPPSAAFS